MTKTITTSSTITKKGPITKKNIFKKLLLLERREKREYRPLKSLFVHVLHIISTAALMLVVVSVATGD
jgi:hypothetical protein